MHRYMYNYMYIHYIYIYYVMKLHGNNEQQEALRLPEKKHCSCDQAHSVLAMKHNEIDEGNNLTDVGHSTTNVDGAK